MASPPTTNRHEEVIGVDFDISKARANLGILQQAVDALKASVGAGGGGIPVALPGVAGVGAGLGGSATTSSVTLAGQQAAVAGMGGAAPSGGGGGGRGGGGTRSSGSLWTDWEISQNTKWGRDADKAEAAASIAAARSAAQVNQSSQAMLHYFTGQMASGNAAGMLGGGIGLAGQMMGAGNPLSMALSVLGTGVTLGVGSQMEASNKRADIDRQFGFVQMAGLAQPRASFEHTANAYLLRKNPELMGLLERAGPGYAESIMTAMRTTIPRSTRNAIEAYGNEVGELEALQKGHAYGLTPNETAQAFRGFSTAMGGVMPSSLARADAMTRFRDGRYPDFIRMMNAGIEPETAGSYQRQYVLGGARGGGGGLGGLVATGQLDFNLRGAVNEWVQSIASNTERLTRQGIRVNLDERDSSGHAGGVLGFMQRIAATQGIGMNAFQAADVSFAMMGDATSLRQRAVQGFRGVGQAAMQFQAASGQKDIFGYLSGLEAQEADPGLVEKAIQRLPPQLRQAYYASLGVRGADAGLMARNLSRFGVDRTQSDVLETSPISRARRVTRETPNFREVAEDVMTPQSFATLTDLAGIFTDAVKKFGLAVAKFGTTGESGTDFFDVMGE